MSIWLSLFLPAMSADCSGGSCPEPHDAAVPAAVEGAVADPPPLDLQKAAHLETATFALG